METGGERGGAKASKQESAVAARRLQPTAP